MRDVFIVPVLFYPSLPVFLPSDTKPILRDPLDIFPTSSLSSSSTILHQSQKVITYTY